MKKTQNTFHKIVSLGGAIIAGCSLIFFASLAAEGQTVSMPSEESGDSSVRGITFPVAELGNCTNKDECKNYCNQPANMDACIAFAKDHGLMTQKDAERAEKFTKHVREGSSPGGCNSPQSCEEYCGSLSHLDECTSFAEKNGFKDEHYEQGKKIQGFLKKGGATPGNCKAKQECEAYCGDFSHAKECFDFAQKAGIMQYDDSKKGVQGRLSGNRHESTAEQLGKIAELAQRGETPGGCNSKTACEKYCSDPNHRDACLEFGVKVGFMHPDEVAKIKQMGGKGPGGCDSEESCKAYCNDPSHREECFKFAEEHGFMTKEEAAHAKEGFVRMRQGFENAPPEVRECLKTALGANILDDIQSGKLVPGPDIGNQMRGCFEKFGGRGNPQEAMKNIPPEAIACLKEKFGSDFEKVRAGKASITLEMADSFRVCFQMMRMDEGFPGEMSGQKWQGERRNNQTPETGMAAGMENMLRSAPPEVAACVKEKFPEGFAGVDESAMVGTKDKIRGCFENFHRSDMERKPMPELVQAGGATGGLVGQTIQDLLRSAPPEVVSCIKEKFPEGFPSAGTGQEIGAEVKEKIRGCFENFHPQGTGTPQNAGYGENSTGQAVKPIFEGQTPPPPSPYLGGFANMPPEVLACVRGTIGEENFQKIQTAPASLELINVVRTCIEKVSNSTGTFPPPEIMPVSGETAPITLIEKLIGAALMPLRWLLGK